MTCTRAFHFSAGHRLLHHEGKCAHPHGHNYIAEITVEGALDKLGRVVDFAVVKQEVGAWIDTHWDHAFVINAHDHDLLAAFELRPEWRRFLMDGNPTAENMARHLFLTCVDLLEPYGVDIRRVRMHETRDCYADALSD